MTRKNDKRGYTVLWETNCIGLNFSDNQIIDNGSWMDDASLSIELNWLLEPTEQLPPDQVDVNVNHGG